MLARHAATVLSVPCLAALAHGQAAPELTHFKGLYSDGTARISVWHDARLGLGVTDYTSGEFRTLVAQGDAFVGDGPDGADDVIIRFSGADAATVAWGSREARPVHRVQLRSETVDWELDGGSVHARLTLPDGDGPHPVVVMVGAPAPLAGLAEWFADSGVATVRYGMQRSSGARSGSRWERGATVLRGVIEKLATHPDIAAERIGIWARERPARIATLAARANGAVAFLLLVAHPAVSDGEMRLHTDLWRAKAPDLADADRLLRLALHFARTGEDFEDYAEARAAAEGAPWLAGLDLPEEADSRRWSALRTPTYSDPLEAFAEVHCPTLALFGEHDITLDVPYNAARMRDALRDCQGARVEVIAGAARGFEQAEATNAADYAGRHRFAPGFFARQGAWLRDVTR